MSDAPLPPLRARLEAVPAEAEKEGAQVFVLRDLEELADKPLALSAGGLLLVSLFDGKRTAVQVQELFKKSANAEIELSVILDLAKALEEAGYLETPAVAAKRKKNLEDFRASSKRPATFAGASYPAEAPALTELLDGFFTVAKGPGKAPALKPTRPAPLGLIAPHIDFERGGHAYAWAYQALSERNPPDVILALGVAHSSPDSPWIFTPKTYETPFGAMTVDSRLYNDLAGRLWYDPRADEWAHKSEHSLEFQAVWLKRLWGEKTPPWVPVLVSSFERFSPEEAPSKIPTIEKALKDFGEALAEHSRKGRRVMILAGVDFAHVGARFGDEFDVTAELEHKIEDEDRRSLVAALSHDADGFYRSAIDGGGWRKVCGLSALYTAVRLIKALGASAPGQLLAYAQAPDPAGGLVSFASAIFDPAPQT